MKSADLDKSILFARISLKMNDLQSNQHINIPENLFHSALFARSEV